MDESVQSYKERLFGYVGDQKPVDVLSRTPERLRNFLEKTDATALDKPPAPDRWSKAQLLAHFAEGEMVLGYRLRMIVSEPGVAIQGYDQNKWVEKAGYYSNEPQKLLELFTALRFANLAYLKSLPDEAWDFYGVHSERGKETVGDLVRLLAGHDLNHLRQLESV
jgi:hypothetical protein